MQGNGAGLENGYKLQVRIDEKSTKARSRQWITDGGGLTKSERTEHTSKYGFISHYRGRIRYCAQGSVSALVCVEADVDIKWTVGKRGTTTPRLQYSKMIKAREWRDRVSHLYQEDKECPE